MITINWTISKEDAAIVRKIAERAVKAEPALFMGDVVMDITATHANGCPLNLAKMLLFDDFNFNHDLYGIHRHLDRNTGELTRCFLPRCARPEVDSDAETCTCGVEASEHALCGCGEVEGRGK